MVCEPLEGVRRLRQRFDNLKIEYCVLKEIGTDLPINKSSDEIFENMERYRIARLAKKKAEQLPASIRQKVKEMVSDKDLLFYSCGVEDINGFFKFRPESFSRTNSNQMVITI